MNEGKGTPHMITNRRAFLKSTGATIATLATTPALGPAVLAARAPGQILGIGMIGLGTRGGDLINAVAPIPGVKVVAVCDAYRPHLQKGIDRSRNPEVKGYVDYRELLSDSRVDAVVIATPDHWHRQMVLDAVRAGKDIYCEKGWALTVAEAKEMRAAIKGASVVFQLGHQARQAACALQAKDLIERGLLGAITLVRTGRFGNTPPDRNIWRWYGYYSQWARPDPAQVVKELDWDLWLGPARKIPFNERHFWHWRCYWEYGTGQAGDLLSHELDFVQYILGYGIPDTCLCAGLNALLHDDREAPDTWNTVYQFEKRGCTVTFDGSMNTTVGQPVEICGKEALLRFDGIAHDITSFSVLPEGFNQRADLPKGYERGKTPTPPNHMVDFLNCVRTRQKPNCNEDEAFIETATYVMSVEAYKQRRMVRWDPVREEIV
jgi:predicted dehydrogenase